MRRLLHSIFLFAGISLTLSFSPFQNEQGQLQIRFRHLVGKALLKLDSTLYKNELGQAFTVSKFKYYISNVQLKSRAGRSYFLERSFLLDEEDGNRKEIMLRGIPFGEYESIAFIIGVDSLHNCSGAQSGDLDPVNAMFWAWNTGYIFMKLEGTSPQAPTPGHFFEYHIGGYKAPHNCIRTVSLSLPQHIILGHDRTQAQLNLQANVLELLRTPSEIDFEKLPAVTDHRNAVLMADNYSDLFSVAEP